MNHANQTVVPDNLLGIIALPNNSKSIELPDDLNIIWEEDYSPLLNSKKYLEKKRKTPTKIHEKIKSLDSRLSKDFEVPNKKLKITIIEKAVNKFNAEDALKNMLQKTIIGLTHKMEWQEQRIDKERQELAKLKEIFFTML